VTTTTENTAKLHPIFQACCAEKKTRYVTDKPYIQDGWLYATDGRIVVRTPSSEPDTEGRGPKNTNDVFAGDFDDEPTPIPDTDYPTEKTVCPHCGGAKDFEDKCEECEGCGRTRCFECGRSWDCPECKGTGKVDGCGQCEGDGSVWPTPTSIEIAPGYGISNRYSALLLAHGATGLYLPVRKHLPGEPAKFTIGPIEGRLMPMAPLKGDT
jgi:hypothetical protein